MKTATTLLLIAATATGFSVQLQSARPSTALNGLFDGVKDAFGAPPSTIDAARETPIDRWMGWSVVSEAKESGTATPAGMFPKMECCLYEVALFLSQRFFCC
jgi:hypothetical protein